MHFRTPLRDGATGEALQAIVELDLDELTAVVPPVDMDATEHSAVGHP